MQHIAAQFFQCFEFFAASEPRLSNSYWPNIVLSKPYTSIKSLFIQLSDL